MDYFKQHIKTIGALVNISDCRTVCVELTKINYSAHVNHNERNVSPSETVCLLMCFS